MRKVRRVIGFDPHMYSWLQQASASYGISIADLVRGAVEKEMMAWDDPHTPSGALSPAERKLVEAVRELQLSCYEAQDGADDDEGD